LPVAIVSVSDAIHSSFSVAHTHLNDIRLDDLHLIVWLGPTSSIDRLGLGWASLRNKLADGVTQFPISRFDAFMTRLGFIPFFNGRGPGGVIEL
jgi:hypothetical protein